MFQVTDAAAAHLAEAARGRGLPDTVGIRVYGEPQSEGGLAVGLVFAEVPAEDDQVAEQSGTRVFLAPEVAGALSEVSLDLKETSEGPKLTLIYSDTGSPF